MAKTKGNDLYVCPRCGEGDNDLTIIGTCEWHLYHGKLVSDPSSMTFDDTNPARCECGFSGTVESFKTQGDMFAADPGDDPLADRVKVAESGPWNGWFGKEPS